MTRILGYVFFGMFDEASTVKIDDAERSGNHQSDAALSLSGADISEGGKSTNNNQGNDANLHTLPTLLTAVNRKP